MKHPNSMTDYPVRVWPEEREASLEYAPYYKGIVEVGIEYLAHIMFVPYFLRKSENWPPILPVHVDLVHSENDARIYAAALADVTVTPDVSLAGQKEFVPLPIMKGRKPEMGVIFYVTPEDFTVFGQELQKLSKQTRTVYDYVPLSTVKHFSFMKFILANIVPFTQSSGNGSHFLTSLLQPDEPSQPRFITNGYERVKEPASLAREA